MRSGRVGAILKLDDKAYVIEFKYENYPPDASFEVKQKLFDKILDEGMKQIKGKENNNEYVRKTGM